jgi:hypothetical protein
MARIKYPHRLKLPGPLLRPHYISQGTIVYSYLVGLLVEGRRKVEKGMNEKMTGEFISVQRSWTRPAARPKLEICQTPRGKGVI